MSDDPEPWESGCLFVIALALALWAVVIVGAWALWRLAFG